MPPCMQGAGELSQEAPRLHPPCPPNSKKASVFPNAPACQAGPSLTHTFLAELSQLSQTCASHELKADDIDSYAV